MFEVKHNMRPGASISFVHQHSAAFQKIAVALKGDVDNRVEQWMPRADKCSQRLTGLCYQ